MRKAADIHGGNDDFQDYFMLNMMNREWAYMVYYTFVECAGCQGYAIKEKSRRVFFCRKISKKVLKKY